MIPRGGLLSASVCPESPSSPACGLRVACPFPGIPSSTLKFRPPFTCQCKGQQQGSAAVSVGFLPFILQENFPGSWPGGALAPEFLFLDAVSLPLPAAPLCVRVCVGGTRAVGGSSEVPPSLPHADRPGRPGARRSGAAPPVRLVCMAVGQLTSSCIDVVSAWVLF